MRPILLPAVLLALTAAAAKADSLEALTGEGRYQLMEINDSIVRLDTRTGGFELCRMQAGAWSCLVAHDERPKLESAIADLSDRVSALEDTLRAKARQDTQQIASAEPEVIGTGTPMAITPAAGGETDSGIIRRITNLIPAVNW